MNGFLLTPSVVFPEVVRRLICQGEGELRMRRPVENGRAR